MKNILALIIFGLFSSHLLASQQMHGENMLKQWIHESNYDFIDGSEFKFWAIKRFMPETYNQVKNDEFQLQPKLTEARDHALMWLSDFNEEPYRVSTTITFGNYNFDKQGFPVNIEVENSTFFYDRSPGFFGLEAWGVALSFEKADLSVFRDAIILMASDSAQRFINEKKDRYGNVNRTLTLEMELEVIGASQEAFRDSLYYKYLPLYVEIKTASVLDGNQTILELK